MVPSNNDPVIRSENLRKILENIRHFYEEDLCHLILQFPDVASLADDPLDNVKEATLLLHLILACAFQSVNKDRFFKNDAVQRLPQDDQSAIVECLQAVTDKQNIVISCDNLDSANLRYALDQIRLLVKEHKSFRELLKSVKKSADLSCPDLDSSFIGLDRSEIDRQAAEIDKLKSDIKQLKDSLDDTEMHLEKCTKDLTAHKDMLEKCKIENQELLQEAQKAKTYRDELDVANEKVEKVERLERELARCKEKIASQSGLKERVHELNKQNQLLAKTKEVMEEDMNKKLAKLNKQNEDYRNRINEMNGKIEELQVTAQTLSREKNQLEENLFSPNTKTKLDDNSFGMDSDDSFFEEKSICEQLMHVSQTKELKLELENRRLSNLVDSMKELSSSKLNEEIINLKDKHYETYVLLANQVKENEKLKKMMEDMKRNSCASIDSNLSSIKRISELESDNNRLKIELQNSSTSVKEKSRALDMATKVINDQKKQMQNLSGNSEASLVCKCKSKSNDYNELKIDYSRLYLANKKLRQDYDRLKAAANRVNTKHQKILNVNRDLEQRNRALTEINLGLEEDKKSMMQHAGQLSAQYHQLVVQSLDDRNKHQQEERRNTERIQNLLLQNDNLKKKIMDLYKESQSNPVKKMSLGKKLKKVGSELLNKSRRFSWIDDSGKGDEKCLDFEFTKARDSDEYSSSNEGNEIHSPIAAKSVKFSRTSDTFNNIVPLIYEEGPLNETDFEKTMNKKMKSSLQNVVEEEMRYSSSEDFKTSSNTSSMTWLDQGCA